MQDPHDARAKGIETIYATIPEIREQRVMTYLSRQIPSEAGATGSSRHRADSVQASRTGYRFHLSPARAPVGVR
jgi:hypothetical protein